ncbi:hypothetical protein FILTAD_01763 [Filibacter tadaridae]|uniref:Uncharacterized protein n=1 Tax=Filibacter tadaridae TaxID=2483811 RepID=A0A3P5XA55_9BACL|nr:hypothetical protein FILTAD_01763 [Filibacter tadaridae]
MRLKSNLFNQGRTGRGGGAVFCNYPNPRYLDANFIKAKLSRKKELSLKAG